MPQLHFIRVDLPLDTTELEEFCKQIEAGLAFKGRPDDKVICLSMASWLGSVDIRKTYP